MEAIDGEGKRRHESPSTRGTIYLAVSGRVGLAVILVEDVDEAVEANALEAGEAAVVVGAAVE